MAVRPQNLTIARRRGACKWFFPLLFAALASACSSNRLTDAVSRLPSPADLPFVYRVEIQQGNVITQDMLAQLQYGMERDKVRYVMGTPIIEDVFHPDRWDYVYSLKPGYGNRQQRRVTLFFEQDKLVAVQGDVKAAEGVLQPALRRSSLVDVPDVERDKSLLQSMVDKVGLGDDGEPDLEPVAKKSAETSPPAEAASEEEAQGDGAEDKEKTTAAAGDDLPDLEGDQSGEKSTDEDEGRPGLLGRVGQGVRDATGLGDGTQSRETKTDKGASGRPLDDADVPGL